MLDNTYDYETIRILASKQLMVTISPRLEHTIDEIVEYIQECYIIDKLWQHNIHKEITYDYCPYNADGYSLKCTIKFSKDVYIDWFEYLLNEHLDTKRGLEIELANSETLFKEVQNRLEDKQ